MTPNETFDLELDARVALKRLLEREWELSDLPGGLLKALSLTPPPKTLPVMSMHGSELECLRARDAYFFDQVVKLRAHVKKLETALDETSGLRCVRHFGDLGTTWLLGEEPIRWTRNKAHALIMTHSHAIRLCEELSTKPWAVELSVDGRQDY